MIKLTYCLRRRPELSWEEFSRHWSDVHAPLVRERAEQLGIRRYVQVRTRRDEAVHEGFRRRNDGAPEPFDGIAELWFDDLGSLQRQSDESRRAARELLEDERRFIDLARSPMWLGDEWEVVPGRER